MAQRSGRVREWIGRYLVAELAGLTTALLAAMAVTSWDPDRLAIAAYASALGEGVGFYAGFLIVRYLREEIDGPPDAGSRSSWPRRWWSSDRPRSSTRS